jgi:serine/threonine protein kinase
MPALLAPHATGGHCISSRPPILELTLPARTDGVRIALAERFHIANELGSGGMAVVYLADDPATGGRVAIKVLRPDLVNFVARERFLREIRIATRLKHPGIVPVIGSGEVNGTLYCVMPYVAGETLRERIARERQLAVRDAVVIAREVADALAFAHEHGFIHRDVKPGNILLHDGHALVADFGIARAIDSSTDANTMTSSGIAMGTPAYMAPEQALRDSGIDGRVDVYALGCVLYEMLAGEPPFSGVTPWTVAARHMSQAPAPLQALRPDIPPALNDIVMRALAKVPAGRFPTAQAMSEALGQVIDEPAVEWSAPPRRLTPMMLAVAGIAALTVGGTMFAIMAHRPPPPVITFAIPAPLGAQFTQDLRDVSPVSPDGKNIIIVGTDSEGTQSLWRRSLDKQVAERIPGTDAGYRAFWAPDGKRLGFFDHTKLEIIDVTGTHKQTLVADAFDPHGGSWADNGAILYAPTSQRGIYMISPDDSAPRRLTTVLAERHEIGHMWPQALPGGRDFLYYVASDVDSVRGIYLGSVDAPHGRRVVGTPASGVYASDNLLYVRNGALVAQHLDVGAAKLTGEPRLIADSVTTSFEYYGVFSASRTGVLVYASGRARDISRLTWFDTSGKPRGYASENGYIRNPIMSRDGRYLAYESYRETSSDIRYVDLTSGMSSALSLGNRQPVDAVWSPDASSFAFIEEQPGEWRVYVASVHDSRPPRLIVRLPHYTVLSDWSGVDGSLILTERSAEGDFDLVARSLDAPDKPRTIASGPGSQAGGRVSPNGQFIAYVSVDSVDASIVVQRYPAGARCVAGRGYQPVWGPGGREVYFLTGTGAVMRVGVDAAAKAPCAVSRPVRLFDTHVRAPGAARSSFDVSAKTGHLLVNDSQVQDRAWLTVTTNWLAAAPPAK